MNHRLKRLVTFLGFTFFLLSQFPVSGKTQNIQQTTQIKRAKENFDFNWQFHKGDIAIKHVVRVGQGGLTDINPQVITGTGNGNPSSHEPDKANQRMAFNGYCLVLVQADKTAGEIRLKASSEKFRGDDVVIKVE